MNGLISIIIPVYNAEKSLAGCLESVLSQTYLNYEAIVIIDGCHDKSAAIAHSYAERDSRIIVIEQENKGAAEARNVGINHASGEFIVFLDNDDYWTSDFLETMYSAQKKTNANLVMCDFWWVDEKKDPTPYVRFNERNYIPDNMFLNRDEFMIKAYKYYSYYAVLWNKLYKREVFNTIRLPKGCAPEDSYILKSVIESAGGAYTLSKKMYYYVQRKGSITDVINDKFSKDDIMAVRSHVEGYKKNGEYNLTMAADCYIGNRIVDYLTNSRSKFSHEHCIWLKKMLRKVLFEMMLSKEISLKRKIKYLILSL